MIATLAAEQLPWYSNKGVVFGVAFALLWVCYFVGKIRRRK